MKKTATPTPKAPEELASTDSSPQPSALGRNPQELDPFTLARVRRGDASASLALVKMYERRVFALIGRMLVSQQRQSWVPDLAQETFLRVFRSIDSFDARGAAKLSTWILTIATRLTIDELRRRRPLLSSDLSVHPSKTTQSAQSVVERKEIASAIERAVAELTEDHRAVFVLREYHAMSYDEIAEALECDVGTVKSRLSRARANLRTALEFLRK